MVASETQGSSTKSYALDPMDRVRTTTTGSRITTQHYDTLTAGGSESPSWTSVNDGTWTRNITGLDGGLAMTAASNGTDTLMINDPHGDVIATMGDFSESTLSALSEQTEFGRPRTGQTPLTNTGPNNYGWLGTHQRDQDSLGGLTLMGERLYNPTTGRFLQTDPVPGGSCNNYDYACQNPITGTDLNGQTQCDDGDCLPPSDFDPVSFLGAHGPDDGDGLRAGCVSTPEVQETCTLPNEGIYEITTDSGDRYVGQSGNITRRLQQHFGRFGQAALRAERTEVLGGKTAREVAEQRKINDRGGVSNLLNERNPIGPARQALLIDGHSD